MRETTSFQEHQDLRGMINNTARRPRWGENRERVEYSGRQHETCGAQTHPGFDQEWSVQLPDRGADTDEHGSQPALCSFCFHGGPRSVLGPRLSLQAFPKAVPLLQMLHSSFCTSSSGMPSHVPQLSVLTPVSKPRYHRPDSCKEPECGQGETAKGRQEGETALPGRLHCPRPGSATYNTLCLATQLYPTLRPHGL